MNIFKGWKRKKEKYQRITWKPRAGRLANLHKVLKEGTSELRFLLITPELIQAPTGKPQLKRGTKGTKQDPVGLLGMEALLCLPSPVGNRLQPSWPSLSSKGQVQTPAAQRREGIRRQGRNNRETSDLGPGPGSPSRDTQFWGHFPTVWHYPLCLAKQ